MLAKRAGKPPIAFQLLLYPVTDLRSMDTPSHLENATGYYLTLKAAGVPCTLTRYHGAIHAFVSMYAFLDAGKAALREAADALRQAIG